MDWKNGEKKQIPVYVFLIAAALIRLLTAALISGLHLSVQMTRLFYQGGTLLAMAVLLLGIGYGWKLRFRNKGSRQKQKEEYFRFCPYCGANVRETDKICVVCGKDMYAEETEQMR
ncbi:hypothetical protein H9X85_06780 [Anaerotignum lactatifermentans]|uniref:Zinc-ribbon domain-containing protein n=1 Tax=Anaerotignum lactatifermentans TaxID=160404 RepID=A0ABS2G7F9_9FIRM|nr:zinc ribbon domain-containing protein [Anaerotignum lactatifermentans]MBM6829343.1 hypothetical protein [Anaerotignum lactatifermentans]MBM6877416.1 hypothetical protein [Anaerotignum lactatifermentans]MBM6950920.1 hypothetical protein [Anaerotignum lactatifermentans]